jgi:hypothetical protein
MAESLATVETANKGKWCNDNLRPVGDVGAFFEEEKQRGCVKT